MIKLTDNIVFAKTGKHLDNLQEAVLCETLKAPEISENC